jgi:hypothetical protein
MLAIAGLFDAVCETTGYSSVSLLLGSIAITLREDQLSLNYPEPPLCL